jgi:hypothetical protein
MYAVLQENENGKKPFKVQVFESAITGASGGVAFSNVGGELTLEDVSVNASSLMSLVSTGSSSTSEGSTFLRRITVTNSDVMVRCVAIAAWSTRHVRHLISLSIHLGRLCGFGGG